MFLCLPGLSFMEPIFIQKLTYGATGHFCWSSACTVSAVLWSFLVIFPTIWAFLFNLGSIFLLQLCPGRFAMVPWTLNLLIKIVTVVTRVFVCLGMLFYPLPWLHLVIIFFFIFMASFLSLVHAQCRAYNNTKHQNEDLSPFALTNYLIIRLKTPVVLLKLKTIVLEISLQSSYLSALQRGASHLVDMTNKLLISTLFRRGEHFFT